jgi:hypothetical protein
VPASGHKVAWTPHRNELTTGVDEVARANEVIRRWRQVAVKDDLSGIINGRQVAGSEKPTSGGRLTWQDHRHNLSPE